MGGTDKRKMSNLSNGQWKLWHSFLPHSGRRHTLLFSVAKGLGLVVRQSGEPKPSLPGFTIIGRAIALGKANERVWDRKHKHEYKGWAGNDDCQPTIMIWKVEMGTLLLLIR